MHLESYEILISSNDVLTHLVQKNAPKDVAIVLLCNDGSESLKISEELKKMTYTNVYVINGGYQQMVTERNQI